MERATQSSSVLYGSPRRPEGRRSSGLDPDVEPPSAAIRAERRVEDLVAAFEADPIDPRKDEVSRYLEEDLRGAQYSILVSVAGRPDTWWAEEDLREHARAQSGSGRPVPIWTFALRRLVDDGYLERGEDDSVRMSL